MYTFLSTCSLGYDRNYNLCINAPFPDDSSSLNDVIGTITPVADDLSPASLQLLGVSST